MKKSPDKRMGWKINNDFYVITMRDKTETYLTNLTRIWTRSIENRSGPVGKQMPFSQTTPQKGDLFLRR